MILHPTPQCLACARHWQCKHPEPCLTSVSGRHSSASAVGRVVALPAVVAAAAADTAAAPGWYNARRDRLLKGSSLARASSRPRPRGEDCGLGASLSGATPVVGGRWVMKGWEEATGQR